MTAPPSVPPSAAPASAPSAVAPGRLRDAACREGPADLRLVPPALAAWGAAALGLQVSGSTAVAGTVACCLAAGALLLRPDRWRGRPGRNGRGPRTAVAAAMTLLCAAAGGGSAALHAADLHRGPVPELARQQVRATVELTLTADPRRTRPRVRGARRTAAGVVLRGEATRVAAARTGPGTTAGTAHVRTPVLAVVRPERLRPWLQLLPSTQVRLRARLIRPLEISPGPRDIAAVLRVRDNGPPEVIESPDGVQRTAGALRSGLREAAAGLAPDQRALLPGLVVGDTSAVPPDLEAAFRATDLTHLLAVSGSNLSILLVLLIGPPGRAVRAERRGLAPRLGLSLRTTAVAAGLLTLAFVVVCRPEPSVLRAAGCGLITVIAIGTGRRRSLLPALAAAVLLLVLYDPWLACDVGFLLSVLATGALLTVAPRWSAALRRRGVPGRPAEVLAAAAAAQALCAPVVAVLSAHVSLVAVPCNLVAELAVAPATVLGFAALATAPFAMSVATALTGLAGVPTGWIAATARTGAALPGATVPWPGSWTGALLLAVLTAALLLLARRLPHHPWLCAAVVLLLLLAIVRPAPLTRVLTGWPPPGWLLAVCDVGQGDALALAAGEGRAVVVDAGPDPVPADTCLRDLGVRVVPLLILTHFHADHVAGLSGVLRGRSVGAIQVTGVREPPEQARSVRRTAAAAGVELVSAAPGERRRSGGLSWEVLWPPAGPAAHLLEANDASITLLVRTGGLTLFLPGDLEPPAQRRLLARHPELSRVDVLKVAHHGSAYQDPGLLRRLRPRLALVSAGAGNDYGHPAPSTLAALRALGSTVLRTDTHGTLAVLRAPGAGDPTPQAVARRR